MGLVVGSRIGPYEIVGPLGAGGMGEVYRARDTKLGRDVAIKILPEPLAADPERRARFEREAKTLAALNHPHIAQIHGFEESTGTSALVMELVEGSTLGERLAHSGRLPIDETVAIALQISDALEAAHDQGIVHRDLKPANIKVRDDGTVKVLDFGLAKLVAGANTVGTGTTSPLSMSPTFTAATMAGVILGTAAYMAPEQARGKTADRRADIWAFGAVLYEMLTAKRAFPGEEISDTLASVLKEEPDWNALPTDLSAPVRRLLRRCLEKDPHRRLSAIGDARLELNERDEAVARDVQRGTWRSWSVALVVAALIGLTATVTILLSSRVRPSLPPITRFSVLPSDKAPIFPDSGGVAISPNGRMIAYMTGSIAPVTSGSQFTGLWLRQVDSPVARQLPGTEGASLPFWSPRQSARILHDRFQIEADRSGDRTRRGNLRRP
jgi:serine/threonine protein kinase